MQVDVLMVNAIGPAFTGDTVRKEGIGGSELEIVQIAEALAEKGYEVAVANGVAAPSKSYGVTYIPFLTCGKTKCRALYIERGTNLAHLTEETAIEADAMVVRATDIMCEHYEPHRRVLEAGHGTLVGVSQWQLEGFRRAIPGLKTACIPPMLGPTRETERVRGRYVYMSAPCKGLDATLAKWRALYAENPEAMRKSNAHLLVALPGHAMGEAPSLSAYDKECMVDFVGVPTVDDWRGLVASAEGLFFVNTMAETFCCAAAFAERSGTRVHMLCLDGRMGPATGGVPEALVDASGVTTDEKAFETRFWRELGERNFLIPEGVEDRSPEALVSHWEAVLELNVEEELVTVASSPSTIPAPPPDPVPEDVAGIIAEGARSDESQMLQESLPRNLEPMDPLFGSFLGLLRKSIAVGGSEFGLGLTLFSLASSIRAGVIVEIGRFKGFSTLALAAAAKLCDVGWQEPAAAHQRRDVDYARFEASRRRRVISIDPHLETEVEPLLEAAGLRSYVELVHQKSDEVLPQDEPIDLLFVDGEHTYDAVRRDVARFGPQVRNGGYIVLHDYFGWFDAEGKNGSPIKRVCDEIAAQGVEHLLVDTGYASLMVFRKGDALAVPKPVPPREDGEPTIGLVIIAKQENPIVARAINSVRSWVDAITVVVDADSTDGTADLCRALGAEVHVRAAPLGIVQARNDALTIAEQRTDYMLILDADDAIEGTRPTGLKADCYDLVVQDHGVSYRRGQLVKSRRGFRYTGCDRDCQWRVRHEFLRRPPGAVYGGTCTTLSYRRLGGVKSVSGWQDSLGTREKYLMHARDLMKHHVDHPECSRTVYYLGQSYRDASEGKDQGLLREAREWFERRAAMQPDEEGAWAAYQAAFMTKMLGEDPSAAFLRAYNMRPTRAESLCELSLWYRHETRKQFEAAYLYASRAAALPLPAEDQLYLNPSVYAWMAKSELAITAHNTGRFDEAIRIFQSVLTLCPPDARAQFQQYLQVSISMRDLRKAS